MSTTPLLKISPSQIDKAKTCYRAWWLKHVLGLPEKQGSNTLFGDIGHGVAERFNKSLPLYPEGWEKQINRFTGLPTGFAVNETEQVLIKTLIDKGITEGVLTRLPDGQTEYPIKYDIGEFHGVKVRFSGFIDYLSLTVGHVQDHKFCGNFKYYGKAKLGKAVAMNAYGQSLYTLGVYDQPTLWLRYNLFRKDIEEPAVKVIEVEKTKEQLQEYWDKEILPVVDTMVLYSKNAKDVHDVPMPEDKMSACNAYGGCPFLQICLGRESCREYKARIDGSSVETKSEEHSKVLEGMNAVEINASGEAQKEGEKKMSLVAELNRKKALAAAAGSGVPVPTPSVPVPAPVQVAAAPVAVKDYTQGGQVPASTAPRQAAPWFSASCTVCTGPDNKNLVLGMNGGRPCAVCKVLSEREGKPSPDSYKMEANDDGTVSFVLKAAPVEEAPVVAQVVPLVAVKAPEMAVKVEAPAKVSLPPPVASSLPTPPAALVKPIEEGLSRKEFAEQFYEPERKGFTVAYHRVQNRKRLSYKFGDANHVIYLRDFMQAVADEILKIAREAGTPADSYYSIPVFTRRDMINANAPRWAELIGNSIIEAVNVPKGSDDQVLIFALEAYASVVIGEPGQ